MGSLTARHYGLIDVKGCYAILPRMNVADFDFDLPRELIAQFPCQERTASRLLCLDKNSGALKHQQFSDIVSYIKPNDLLIFNDTRVIPARLYGVKDTGGKVEILIERVLTDNFVLAHVGASKSPKPGGKIFVNGDIELEMIERADELFKLKFNTAANVFDVLESVGHVPLPPYIERDDKDFDKERYQTVYAKRKGAVAAPTAGLHFDEKILEEIKSQGAKTAFITLHVGAGTFQPVRVDDIHEHKMHSEYIEVSSEVCEQIKETKALGGRIIAVGTTTVRSLETAALNGEISPYMGDTDIFIFPGFKFKCIDAMVTNFHLPKSTLIMLVAAFAGYENVMHAYREAVKEKYRFFSYGDAMLIY